MLYLQHARQNVICEDGDQEMDNSSAPDDTYSLAMAGLVIN